VPVVLEGKRVIVDADNPPPRVLFGSEPVELVKHLCAQRLQTWSDWEQLSRASEGSGHSPG